MSLLQKRLQQQKDNQTQEAINTGPSNKEVWRRVKEKVLHEAIKLIDIEAMEQLESAERSNLISQEVANIVKNVQNDLDFTLNRADYHRMVGELVSEIIGYGPITPLLADQTINEILVNGPSQVYVERQGMLESTNISFRDDNHLLHIIERIVAPLGKRIDESSPMVDARLPDGSRVNATVPPVALDGPTLSIRKFSAKPFTMGDFIRFGTLSTDMAVFIKACVAGRLNIIVGGGTGSGKTSTLNVLSSFIPSHERIITIEDAAELHLMQDHVVRMEARPPNIEQKGQITIRDLVINSLRMRPDRIMVGEVRGGEALDMLQAMNTGHDGSITTGHANSPRDLLYRLETMVMMAGVDLPSKAIREQLASALNLIIYQSRLRDGTRKITKVVEVVGMEGDTITLQDIFVFDELSVGADGKIMGNFRPTGILPKCLKTLESKENPVPISIFQKG